MIHGVTIFCAAFLLFLVQPLIAKFLLPLYGGGSAIWTTCLLFFQVCLLLGYGYAHLIASRLRPRAQVVVHLTLLFGGLALLPITPPLTPSDLGASSPALSILAVLARTIGLPYTLLAATSPLLQRWFVSARGGSMPYRLYSLSNVGSLLALFAYPLLVEPAMSRTAQSLAWSGGFVACVLLCAACGRGVWRAANDSAPVAAAKPAERARIRWHHRSLWLAMPACATVLLIAITNKLTQDVAPVPFLWVLPLALYLLTFVVAFENPRWYSRRFFGTILAGSAIWVCLVEIRDADLGWQLAAHCSLLFSAGMVCHGEVYRLRPPAEHLTAFYLWVALGGALGGCFVTLVAPVLYTDYYELPLGALSVLLLLLVAICLEPEFAFRRGRLRWGALVLSACFLVVAVGSLMIANHRADGSIYRSRNFYGVLTVQEIKPAFPGAPGNPHRRLVHGNITHGAQFTSDELRDYPTTYYEPSTGIGRAFEALRPRGALRVGALGLGTGTIAAYGEKGDQFVFYEINPEVLKIALNYFTFLGDSAADVDVVLGDARLALAGSERQRFDLLVVDAFSGDSIPLHLISTEAVELYLWHMDPRGVLAFHISNRYLDLEPVVVELAKHFGLGSALLERGECQYPSRWLLLSRDEAFLRSPVMPEGCVVPRRPVDGQPWTDDASNLLEVLDL